MIRRRALLAASAIVNIGGLNVTLYAGDNGQLGIDVYNYLVDNGTPNAAGGLDWESTEVDNLLITGEGLTNQRVARCTSDSKGGWFWFSWDNMSDWWLIYLYPNGYLNLEYDD